MECTGYLGCKGDIYAKALCHTHYLQTIKGREIRPRTEDRECVIVGCTSPPYKGNASKCADHRGVCSVEACERTSLNKNNLDGKMCSFHYQRKRQGIPFDRPVQEFGDNWYLDNGYEVRDVRENGVRRKEFRHRKVMEDALGRKLLPGENVHHINGVRNDNRLENLELWSTSQPSGQRVEDKVEWALQLLALYGEDFEQPNSRS